MPSDCEIALKSCDCVTGFVRQRATPNSAARRLSSLRPADDSMITVALSKSAVSCIRFSSVESVHARHHDIEQHEPKRLAGVPTRVALQPSASCPLAAEVDFIPQLLISSWQMSRFVCVVVHDKHGQVVQRFQRGRLGLAAVRSIAETAR